MEATEEKFRRLPDRMGPAEYNYAHFRREHLLADARRLLREPRIRPGDPAPGFSLVRVGGGVLSLEDLLGKPFLMRFGSFT